jgi:hypothetical protein
MVDPAEGPAAEAPHQLVVAQIDPRQRVFAHDAGIGKSGAAEIVWGDLQRSVRNDLLFQMFIYIYEESETARHAYSQPQAASTAPSRPFT